MIRLLVAGALTLVATLPAQPAAQAAAAPWTWKRVTVPVDVQPTSSYAIRAMCPAGYTAITGGLQIPIFSQVLTLGQYRQDDLSGSGWSVIFRNNSTSTGTASVVAECVETADLPPISYQLLEFTRDANGYAQGSVPCPNPGEVVLTGGVDWNNTSSGRNVYSSTPAYGSGAWYGYGYNPVSGAKLAVEVYCVDPAYVPGFQYIELTPSANDWSEDSLVCPLGKRILNGGVYRIGYASYPNINKWTATTVSGTRTLRATCVDAGSPTVSIFQSSVGNGGLTNSATASFYMSGTDPAGYPNNFRCSLDGAPPTSCNFGASYSGLSSGSHQFVTWNVTADGRSSGPATIQWTIDTVAPTVTKAKLSDVTLGASTLAQWSGSDQQSGIRFYKASYDLFHTDGTSTGWKTPKSWRRVGKSVQTPDLALGESVCISVRAYDKAYNSSPWSAPSCTARPFDDRALTASTGWTRATGSAFWLNTITRTTGAGETLTRSNVHLKRVGIVATECAGCGSVVVDVGGTRIGRINLDATATTNRTVHLLPGFGDTSGVVKITSVTTGQQMSIDGLVAIQGTTAPPPP